MEYYVIELASGVSYQLSWSKSNF